MSKTIFSNKDFSGYVVANFMPSERGGEIGLFRLCDGQSAPWMVANKWAIINGELHWLDDSAAWNYTSYAEAMEDFNDRCREYKF